MAAGNCSKRVLVLKRLVLIMALSLIRADPCPAPAQSAGAGGTAPGKVEGQDNWPRFRGKNADGVSADDPRLPDTWGKKENVQWVADVPGNGISCPVVWGDKVFLTTVVSDGEKAQPKKGL